MEAKEKIIHHTTELLSQKGFDATSVRDIAAAADVNVAMINYYFGGKEALFEAVIQEKLSFLQRVFSDMVKNPDLSAIEKIDKVIDLLIERKFSNRKFHHLLHNELALKKRPQLKEKISQTLMLNISPVKKIFEEGVRTGEFNRVDVEMMVTTVVGSIHYLLISDTICQRILGKKSNYTPFDDEQLKKRLSNHLKKLVRTYLLQ